MAVSFLNRPGGADKWHGADPRLGEILEAAQKYLPQGYTIKPVSGHRPGDTGFHGHGKAVDIKIVDPSGKELTNYGEDPTGYYKQLARGAYQEALQRYPDLKGQFAWGGAFGTQKGTGGGPRDLMHFDLGGERGRYTDYRLSNMGPLNQAPSQPSSLLQHFSSLEQKYNIPAGFLARTRAIESNNGTNLQSPTGPRGPFQFTKGTAARFGLPLDQRDNEYASAEAAAKYAAENKSVLQQALGREPTGAELYYAHQQGGPGAAKLLTNPEGVATRLTDPKNIRYNAGGATESAASHFAKFQSKYDNAKPDNLGAPFMGAGNNPNAPRGSSPGQYAAPPTGTLVSGGGPTAQPVPPPAIQQPAIRQGGGLLGALLSGEGNASGVMSGKSAEMAAAKAGLNFMQQQEAAGAAAKAPPPPLPAMPALPADALENKPDLSLIAQLAARRKKLGLGGGGVGFMRA